MIHGVSVIDDSLARSDVGNKIYHRFEAKYISMDKLGLAADKVIVKIIPKRIVHWRGMKFTSTIPVDKRHTVGEAGISTITISRQVGSRGNEVAKRLCELLGYQYVSKEVIAETACKMGITAQEFVDTSEDSYRFKGLLDRLLGRGEAVATAETMVGREYYQRLKFDEERSLGVLRAILTSLSRLGVVLGGVVIVGRGGQVLLRNHENVFHVRIVAPKESRVKAVMERYGLNEDKAVQFIEERDRAAAQYLKRFYGVDWDDPSLYDMRIDMRRLSVENVARAIAEAVKLRKSL
jgi:cytidylate kinase